MRRLEEEEDGGEDARGRMVGLATSPLNKKVGEGTLPTRASRVGKFFSAVRLLVAAATPMSQSDIVFNSVVATFLIGTVTEIKRHADFVLNHPLGGDAVSVVGEPLALLATTRIASTWWSGIGSAPERCGKADLLCGFLEEFLDLGPVVPRHVCVFAGIKEIFDNSETFLPAEHV